MKTVSSADGTTIAYEREGTGPALIIVDGALCARGAKARPGRAARRGLHGVPVRPARAR